jgi:hypothetical protein
LTISISKSGVAPDDPWNLSEKYKYIYHAVYSHKNRAFTDGRRKLPIIVQQL